MIVVIAFIILISFTISMGILLYNRSKYKKVPVVVEDLEEMLEEDKERNI